MGPAVKFDDSGLASLNPCLNFYAAHSWNPYLTDKAISMLVFAPTIWLIWIFGRVQVTLMHANCCDSILFCFPGLIQRDALILEFACSFLYKIKDEHRRNSDMRVICTKVRMLGRMVAEVHGRTSPAYSLSDMLCTRMFDHVVEAVDVLTNHSP